MAVQAYDSIISDEVLKQKLMKFSNQLYAFVQILPNVAEFSEVLSTVKYLSCDQMHVNFKLILQTAFNCFAKTNFNVSINVKLMLHQKCLALYLNSWPKAMEIVMMLKYLFFSHKTTCVEIDIQFTHTLSDP